MKIVVILSGASGVSIGLDMASFLASLSGVKVYLVATKGAKKTLKYESKIKFKDFKKQHENIIFCKNSNLAESISSGSFEIDAYFVYASASFCAAAASGLAHNLALRALAVGFKERRKIIIAPREMPLSLMMLKALLRLYKAGALIAPPLAGEYAKCSAKEFLIGRWALMLGLKSEKFTPWKGIKK